MGGERYGTDGLFPRIFGAGRDVPGSAAATVAGLIAMRIREGRERVPIPGYPWIPGFYGALERGGFGMSSRRLRVERSTMTRSYRMSRIAIQARLVLAAAFVLALSFGCSSEEVGDAAEPIPAAKRDRELPDYTSRIQILREQIVAVLDVIDTFAEPQVLIWGVGHDSKLWCNENKNGTTIFIEDIPKWANLAREQMDCRIVMVEYDTFVRDADQLIEHPERLVLELPDDVGGMQFDVIVVDAPHGFSGDKPGRMKPIYMSSVLSHEGSHVFVDDWGRKVERTYSIRYLSPKFGDPVLIEGRGRIAHYSKREAR